MVRTAALGQARVAVFVLAIASASAVPGCAQVAVRGVARPDLAPAQRAELWEEPQDIATRDLYLGPGGSRLQPSAEADYAFKALDTTGMSRGFDVVDPQGRTWDVKIGPEAQVEVAVSRLLWAIGFHQPNVYFLSNWKLTGWQDARPGAGRFRLSSDHKTVGEWAWQDNPFVGTREMQGLLVAQLLLNNWDLKTPQNRIYARNEGDQGPRQWFVVQDIGAALGKTRWPTGTKGVIEDYERMTFIKAVEDGRVRFGYSARHQELFKNISPGDVVWTCRLFDRLSPTQWADAFAGAGYTPALAERFVKAVRARVAQGLALQPAGGAAS